MVDEADKRHPRQQSDAENVILATGVESVDRANQEFYGRFPFPPLPMSIPRLDDPDFETVMLNQSIGDYDVRTIPANGNIWVAGCGTSQAILTALKFPRATVVGSDLSAPALDLASQIADKLGVTNLTLRQESLNHVTFRDEFDYVLSTGVVHHNSDPALALRNIARSLRPDGLLELMVYNRFHRTFSTAFQKAVRMVSRHGGRLTSYDEELAIAKAFLDSEALASKRHLARYKTLHESSVADWLIQPVEYSYTVESLDGLATECGLELLLPCHNRFDHIPYRSWALQYSTAALEETITALPDTQRWQIANLLLLDASPALWFFLRRTRDDHDACYEIRVNERFLRRRFARASTTVCHYVRREHELEFDRSEPIPYPPACDKLVIKDIVGCADGQRTMREILNELNIDARTLKSVSDIRIQTTTSLYPYLIAV